MRVTIDVNIKRVTLSDALKDRIGLSHSRGILIKNVQFEIQDLLEDVATYQISRDSIEIRTQATQFSEQMVFDPLAQIDHYFTYKSGMNLGTGYAPLYYSVTDKNLMSANKSAVAAIGEGVAGLMAKKLYSLFHVFRPNNDYPDIVMTDSSSTKTFLVEAKATVRGNITTTLNNELPKFSSLVASSRKCLPEELDISGLLIGTEINNVDHYTCHIYEVIV